MKIDAVEQTAFTLYSLWPSSGGLNRRRSRL